VVDPLGRRWFGILTLAVCLGALSEFLLPDFVGLLVYAVLVAVTSCVLIGVAQLWPRAGDWLQGHWR
jgi:hypothetical protein